MEQNQGTLMAASPPRPAIPRLSELDLTLETPRLVLRQFTESDVDDIWPVVSQAEFPKMMSWAAHTDPNETLGFVRAVNKGLEQNAGVVWAIVFEQRVVGSIGLDSMVFALRAVRIDRAELGFWLAPEHWNKGLMTEAADAVMRCAFQTIGLHKVTVGCIADNVASRRVIEKLGFRYVGRLEDDVWRDGKWHSQLRYELTAPEWPDVHTTMRISSKPPA
jgi:[ribosomal protein S5]-alanine N-acetyltransferase